MDGIIIKYSKNVYQTKINQLEGYLTQLNQHLDNLENYKVQLNEFWSDEDSVRYLNLLTSEIIGVKNAINRVSNLKSIYKEIVDQLSTSQGTVDSLIGDAESAIKSLGISE